MDSSKLNVVQLQKRDPIAWATLLRTVSEDKRIRVSAVKAEALPASPGSDHEQLVFRYTLTLAGQSDPITLLGKRTNDVETAFYQEIASELPWLAPRCFFASRSSDEGWIVIDDVPNHFPPDKWTPTDVEQVIDGLAKLHSSFWNKENKLRGVGLPHFIDQKRYSWKELKQKREIFFEEGPAAVISEHAVESAGRLAPTLLEAANGLTVIRDLGGWPGVMGESHLTAAADLLDDPVPMLEPLRDLPLTLVHGNPNGYHWHLTLFDELRLFSWRGALVGPGIWDLISFMEPFALIYDGNPWRIRPRSHELLTEETMVDSYLLAMSSRLGKEFDARAMRQAIPAARCLYVVTTWFSHFAHWFSEMPSKYTWQKINRMRDDQLVGTVFQPMIGLRPYLASVFRGFLKAYRTL